MPTETPAGEPRAGDASRADGPRTDGPDSMTDPMTAPEVGQSVRRAGCGVFWLDENLCVRRANAAFARLLGLDETQVNPPAGAAGVSFPALDPDWPHGPPAEAFASLRAVASAGHPAKLRRDGAGPLSVQVHLNHVSLGGLESLFGVVVDTGARQAAEDALRASEARYRAITDTQTEFIIRFRPDAAHTMTFANRAFAEFTGLPDPGAAIGKPMPDFVHPDDREAVLARVRSVSAENPIAHGENRIVGADGKPRFSSWVNRAVLAPPDPDRANDPAAAREVLEIQAVGRDITERVLAEFAGD